MKYECFPKLCSIKIKRSTKSLHSLLRSIMPKQHHKRANRNPKNPTADTVITTEKLDKTIPQELQETVVTLATTGSVSTLNNMVDDVSIGTEKSNHSNHCENVVSNDVNESLISNESSWRDVDHTPVKAVNYDTDRQDKYKYDYNRSMKIERNESEIDENETGICHISQPSTIHLSSSCDTLLTNLAIETPYTNNERKTTYFNDEDDDNACNHDYRRLENVDGSSNSNSWKRLTMEADVILQDISLSSLVPSSPLSETETSNDQQGQDDFVDMNKIKTSKRIKKIFLFTGNENNRTDDNNKKWSFIYYCNLLIRHILHILSQSSIIQKCQELIQSVFTWYILTLVWCIKLPYRTLRYMIMLPYTITLWCFELMLDILNHLTALLIGNWKRKPTSTSKTYGGISASAAATTISSSAASASGSSNYRHTVIMSSRVTSFNDT